jgi:carboxyl-terminal processing protease
VPVKLEVLNEQDKRIQLEVMRKARQLSGGQLEFEFEKLESNIGYIKFNFFFGELLPKFQAALRELRDTEALIIDLRGNPGGAGDLAPAIANLLSANAGSLGSLQARYASLPYSYKGMGDQAYKGKAILLVDEHSASTAEVFSGGLQENKRVTVIGTPTSGGVLPSMMRLLPTGGLLVHVISNFQTPKGVVLEGRGVLPEITATFSRKALLAGCDPVRERAIQFIKTSK